MPFKAAPSHLCLKDAPVIGKGLQRAKLLLQNITVGLVGVYRRNLSNIQGFSSGINGMV